MEKRLPDGVTHKRTFESGRRTSSDYYYRFIAWQDGITRRRRRIRFRFSGGKSTEIVGSEVTKKTNGERKKRFISNRLNNESFSSANFGTD